VVEQRAFESILDFTCCSVERAALSGTGSAGCIPCEELEFVSPSSEGEKLHREVYHGTGGRTLLEASVEWCGDVATVGRRVLERDLCQP
jgi:hypothetical protein